MPPRFGGAPKCPRCQKSVYMAEQVIGPGGAWHANCLTCKECNKRLDSSLSERDGEVYCKVCYTRQWGPKGYGFAGGAAFLSTETKLPSEILNESRQTNSYSPVTSAPPTIPPTPPALPSTRPSMQPPTLPPRMSESPKLPERQAQPIEPAISADEPGSPASEDSDWSNPNPPPSLPKKPEAFSPIDQPRSIGTYKTSYMNHHTGYVPRKTGITIQNDTCTKCGKSVYAAELALGAGNKYHKFCLKCCECGKLLSSTNMVDRDSDLYCRGCYSRSFGPKGYGFGNLLTPEGATR
ncbi:hypothetical protein CLU79DRAFT_837904 [Phycomyces nitens]|nr:hypothetical protein CLU79DRAFT_837904 [Phycomyces nitens]